MSFLNSVPELTNIYNSESACIVFFSYSTFTTFASVFWNVSNSGIGTESSTKVSAILPGMVQALYFNCSPFSVREIVTHLSSVLDRRRKTSPLCSNRFSRGVKVLDSSMSSFPISLTFISLCSHNTNSTRYCG